MYIYTYIHTYIYIYIYILYINVHKEVPLDSDKKVYNDFY